MMMWDQNFTIRHIYLFLQFFFLKSMYMKYLKAFVAASSWIVTLPFFYTVYNLKDKKNYSYFNYTMIAPVWLGFWSVISLIIADYFGLSMRERFLILTFITYSLSIMIVKYLDSYNYNEKEWKQYYIRLFIKHFIMWNVVVFNIEKYI